MSIAADRVVVVEGELTVFAVHLLKDSLLEALSKPGPLTVDLHGVSEVDGAGIQMLLAARREAAQRGTELTFAGHAPVVVEAIELIGLGREFGWPVADQENAA